MSRFTTSWVLTSTFSTTTRNSYSISNSPSAVYIAEGHLSQILPSYESIPLPISIELSMPGSVVWKWKADASRQATGSSMSKSSPREAFAAWCDPLPRNSVECGIIRSGAIHDLELKRYHYDLFL